MVKCITESLERLTIFSVIVKVAEGIQALLVAWVKVHVNAFQLLKGKLVQFKSRLPVSSEVFAEHAVRVSLTNTLKVILTSIFCWQRLIHRKICPQPSIFA